MTDEATTPGPIAAAHETVTRLRDTLREAVVGQDAVIDQTLMAFMAAGHVLVEGVPGLGKTLLVRSLARCFDGRFSRIQFTPDLMPSDVTGHAVYNMQRGEFEIRRGPVFTHLLLADEINRAPAKTQAALLEVMQEGQVTIEGEAHVTPTPFMVMATQNPIEQEGTYPLPEAELDRFLMKIRMDYPADEHEQALVRLNTAGDPGADFHLERLRSVIEPSGVLGLQAAASRITTDEAIIDYAVRLVRATREWPGVIKGAGPRGSINLIRAGRAQALLEGRGFVTPDDVKAIALPVLRHRLLLSPELEIEGTSTDQVLAELLASVEAPRH